MNRSESSIPESIHLFAHFISYSIYKNLAPLQKGNDLSILL